MSVLHKPYVLCLNRGWQAVQTKTTAEALTMLSTDVACGLDISGDSMLPVKWEDWLKLPVREGDDAVLTVRGPIRAPRVIVLSKFSKVPTKRPKLSLRSIRQRDNDVCQYSGKKLRPAEMSLDHIEPRSRGGKDTWTNIVLASKEINYKKGNRTPEEFGVKLLKQPREVLPIPVTLLIDNPAGLPEWEPFLVKR